MFRELAKIGSRWRKPRSIATPEFVNAGRVSKLEPLLQFLAFGFCFTRERAEQAIEFFADCKEMWLHSGEERAYRALSCNAQNGFIADLLTSVVRQAFDGSRPPALGISAGFDSRAILHVLQRMGIAPLTYTFGQVGNLDFDFARELARRMALETSFFDTSEMEWSLSAFDRETPNRLDIPLSPRVIVKQHLDDIAPKRRELHGFLNGQLTGARTQKQPSNSWSAAIGTFCQMNDTFLLQSFIPDCHRLLPQESLAETFALSFDEQLSLALRQWQRIRLTPFPQQSELCFPFENRQWIGFWLSRGRHELAGQSRYLQFLRSLQGEVFFDLHACKGESRTALRKERLHQFCELEERDTNKTRPKNPTAHFCVAACYRNNVSFRRTIDESINRLKRRRVFSPAFIDDTLLRFERDEQGAGKRINGLVSADLALEAGLFD